MTSYAVVARGGARALLGGVVGTAAMTATTALESRWRGKVGHPVNPDASHHVAVAVGTVLRRQPQDHAEQQAYFLLAHWGYGSAVALTYPLLRRVSPTDRRAAGLLWLGCQGMAMALFPAIGGTKGAHRWPRDVLLSSLAHHVVYVAAVAAVERATRPAEDGEPGRGAAGPADRS